MDGRAVLRTDGGARGNPGPAGAAFVLQDEEGNALASGGRFIGEATNNVAEYEALLWGLQYAADRGFERLTVLCDSELAVRQLTGVYRVKHENIKPLHAAAMSLLAGFADVEILHVRREDNALADSLVNQAIDSRSSVGDAAVLSGRRRQPTLFEGDAPVEGGVGITRRSGVYELTVKSHFDAAHALRGYPGECRELHGHTWDVEVTVGAEELDEIGIVYDFKTLKDDLAAVLAPYDHGYLNDVPPFDEMTPTAENLARVIYEALAARVDPSVSVTSVSVWESPVARLVYRPGRQE